MKMLYTNQPVIQWRDEVGMNFAHVLTVSIQGHAIDVWHDDDGRLCDRWAADNGLLRAIQLLTDDGPVVFAGPVLLMTCDDEGNSCPIPDGLEVQYKLGYVDPL